MFFPKRFALFAAAIAAALISAALLEGYFALRRADTAAGEGDYRAAAEAYVRAARLLFWRKDLLEQAAFAAVQYGDDSTAVYYFQRAELSPRGRLALGYAYYRLGDVGAAQSVFEEGARRYRAAPFYEGLALTYHLQKNWEEERRAVETQIQLEAGNASAHYRLGVLLSLLEPELALPELMRAAALDKRFDPPAQTLRAALNLSAVEPDSAERMVAIGRALGLIEEWELARDAFQKAADLDPKNPKARAWLGEAKQHTGEESRADLDLAVRLDPKSSIARGLSALYWERRGEDRRALAEYLLAAQYDPQNPVWVVSLAQSYVRVGDLIAALSAYQRATELEPNEAAYWRMLAVFCADNGVSAEEIGLPAAQKAAELAPEDPLVLEALGYAYYVTGRYANAEKILTDVTARFPQQYSAQIRLALNYLAQGNDASAYRLLLSVRDADRDGADGALARSLLEKYFP